MRQVCGGEVVGVNLRFQDFGRSVDKEAGVGGSGTVPDYVRDIVVVPAGCFGNYLGAGGGEGKVGAYVVEALS